MAGILFNNDSNSAKQNDPQKENAKSAAQGETVKNEIDSAVLKQDDFAIFPQWDVVPPNAIINPRLKKNI